MSGYTPVFRSVFQGTLCGKYPELPVWLVLLALADRHGEIDAHPSYIAMVSGLPQADIETAIRKFCEPDEASRSAAGRVSNTNVNVARARRSNGVTPGYPFTCW